MKKNNWKTIKQATNKFNATTNENDDPHLEMEAKSGNSEDSIDKRTDANNRKEKQTATFISLTIPNANTEPTPYSSAEFEDDKSPPILRKRRSSSATSSPSRQEKNKKGKSSHSSVDNDNEHPYNESNHRIMGSRDKKRTIKIQILSLLTSTGIAFYFSSLNQPRRTDRTPVIPYI